MEGGGKFVTLRIERGRCFVRNAVVVFIGHDGSRLEEPHNDFCATRRKGNDKRRPKFDQIQSESQEHDQKVEGFVIECRAMERVFEPQEDNGIEEVLTTDEAVSVVLKNFEDVSNWPKTLPPQRNIEHHIHLKQGTDLVNVRPYRYAYQQKAEMDKLVDEMLTAGIIRPSNSPYLVQFYW